MRRALFLAVMTTVAATPALAQRVAIPPPGALMRAPDGGLIISSLSCATLGQIPGAAYQPGIDASGNAVAPADLPGPPPSPTVDNFPIEIDKQLAGKFNLPKGLTGQAIVGYVTLRDNKAYFNGEPLSTGQSTALAEACKRAKH